MTTLGLLGMISTGVVLARATALAFAMSLLRCSRVQEGGYPPGNTGGGGVGVLSSLSARLFAVGDRPNAPPEVRAGPQFAHLNVSVPLRDVQQVSRHVHFAPSAASLITAR